MGWGEVKIIVKDRIVFKGIEPIGIVSVPIRIAGGPIGIVSVPIRIARGPISIVSGPTSKV